MSGTKFTSTSTTPVTLYKISVFLGYLKANKTTQKHTQLSIDL